MSEAYHNFSREYLETLREGDSGLGLPDFVPQEVRRLTAAESAEHAKKVEAEWRAQFERKLADLEAATSAGLEIPKGVRSFFGGLMLLTACVLGLLLITQFLQAMAGLEALPETSRWLVGGALALIGLVVSYYIGRLLMIYLKLKTHRQLNIRALNIIAERRQMQVMAEEKSREARKMFTSYLKEYPVEKVAPEKLRALGIEPQAIEKLKAARTKLLGMGTAEPSRPWLEEFRESFQAVLDEAASNRVWNYSLKAGMTTMTSPNAVLDQMIVLYTCTAMIGDLMRIYNIRPALGRTGVVLAQAIAHAYLSGVFDQATESAADSLGETLKGMAHTGPELMGFRMAKFVSAKMAEGTINGLLVRRLGRQTIRLLQPMREK